MNSEDFKTVFCIQLKIVINVHIQDRLHAISVHTYRQTDSCVYNDYVYDSVFIFLKPVATKCLFLLSFCMHTVFKNNFTYFRTCRPLTSFIELKDICY